MTRNALFVSLGIFIGLAFPRGSQAAEWNELIGCYDSIEMYSVNNAQRTFEIHAIPATREGKEGVYLYVDNRATFYAIPAADLTGTYHHSSFLFDDGHGEPLRCIYRATYIDHKLDPPEVECGFTIGFDDDYRGLKPVTGKPVPATEATQRFRNMLSERIASMPAKLRADTFGWRGEQDPEAQLRQSAKNTGTDNEFLKFLAKLGRRPRYQPDRSEALRALKPCLKLEDETLRLGAITTQSLLRSVPLPPEKTQAAAPGCP